jgi:hypothetical protein
MEQANNEALSTQLIETSSFILDLKKYLFFAGIAALIGLLYYESKKKKVDNWQVR